MEMLSLFTISYVQAVVVMPLDLLFKKKNTFFFMENILNFLNQQKIFKVDCVDW